MQDSRSRSGVNSGGRMVLISLTLILLMGVGLVGLWWTAAMRTPTVTIPNPILPKPNAFDFYVAASNAIVNDKQVGDAASGKYATVSYSMAQKERLVQQNIGAIHTLHQGFAYPYLNPPCLSIEEPLPYYAKFRGMARLLTLRGQVQSAQGDWSGATDSYLDAMRLGEDMPHGSMLIGTLAGMACQAIGRSRMWNTVEHLNVVQSRAALNRLSSLLERNLPYADAVQEEKWYGQRCRMEIFDNPAMRDSLFVPHNEADDPQAARAASSSRFLYLLYSKRSIMQDFTAYMDAVSAQVRRPYAAKLPPPTQPADPFNQAMMTDYFYEWFKEIESETQNRLLLVTLALHAFQVEHGRYPSSLVELAPVYLKKLPDDPFAMQGTFRYQVKGKSYILYSVGPDGKDDGGTQIDDPKKATNNSPNARYRVDADSVGDIVAGKSLW
ncbi:MAG: hypothetical protein JWL77_5667 [Chthonomonadaceae bacterium]|nr:hypothetical protein [Chthonomonadaceae bacterium]